MKLLRIILLILLGVIVLAVGAAAVFVATFDANRYKPQVERLVLERTGRVLNIDGDINLTLFPRIGAAIGHITLSDLDSKEGQDPFITIESSDVSVALMPLLRRQVLIDGLSINGLDVSVTRNRGGTFNFEDLITPKDSASAPTLPGPPTSDTAAPALEFDISSISVNNARLRYRDFINELDLDASGLHIKTGQIAPRSSGRLEVSARIASSALLLDTQWQLSSHYQLDLDAQRIGLERLAVKVTGQWQTLASIDAAIDLNLAANGATTALSLSDVRAALEAQLAGDALNAQLNTSQVELHGNAVSLQPSEIKLTLNSPTRRVATDLKLPAFDLRDDELNLKALSANASITDRAFGSDALTMTATADLSLNTKKETLTTQLTGELDGAAMNASLGVRGLAKPAITFDVQLNELKLDRYLVAQNQSGSATTSAPDQKSGSGSPQMTEAIELSVLKGPNVSGKLQVGKLLIKGQTIEEVQAQIALNQGRLAVAPMSAQLFGGKLSGSLAIDSHNNHFALKQTASGVRLESLLSALGQDPKVTGLGALNLDVTTSGASTTALTQNLAGHASVNLRDGAIKGIDIGAILGNVRRMLGKADTEQGSGSGQTTFTELSASATIQKGIATNDDLIVRAPMFRVEGNGTINIAASTLDYNARVAVVETSTGQDGADLAQLRGLTVPVRITGTFDNPRYRVDVASLAAELAKSKLGDRARDEINKVVPGLGDALKGILGR